MIPWAHLKYMDESHFDRRSLYQRRGWAPSGKRLEGIKPATPGAPSCSITIMTTLLEPGGFVIAEPRFGTNTTADFVVFVLEQVVAGYLVAGDYLICDNAAIHVSGANILYDVLHARGITIRFLPTYSPELNPCELIFAQLKQRIRNNRQPIPIVDEIVNACAHVHRDNVVRYYRHCIDYIIHGQ